MQILHIANGEMTNLTPIILRTIVIPMDASLDARLILPDDKVTLEQIDRVIEYLEFLRKFIKIPTTPADYFATFAGDGVNPQWSGNPAEDR